MTDRPYEEKNATDGKPMARQYYIEPKAGPVTINLPENGDSVSLRDQYAMAVLTGYLANPARFERDGGQSIESCIWEAFEWADEALRQRGSHGE